jgi:predicted outer membrane repeat protein
MSVYAADLEVGSGKTYADIKSAITAASNGDVVIVSDGTYTGANNTMLSFSGKNITVKSENGPAGCIIDCENSMNSTAFNFNMTGEPATAVLEGFTITRATNNAININGGWDGSTCPTIKNCVIQNSTAFRGAGIICIDTPAVITGCTIKENSATLGAAISVGGAYSPTIADCVISDNTASESGGGIYCDPFMNPIIKNCLLTGNTCTQYGGAIFCNYGSNPTITNCTIEGNAAGVYGGGLYCYSDYSSSTLPVVTNTTFANNTNFAIYEDGLNADPQVSYCHFYNNSVADFRDYDSWEWTGAADINMNVSNAQNIIDGNPLFIAGPLGAYYLSQTSSGQASNSPCVDTGSDTALNLALDDRTTRTDGVYDSGTADIGYHYPDPPANLYELTASVIGSNGTVSPESGSFAANSVIDMTATPNAGYRVKQWSGTDNDALKTAANQVTMNDNKTVTVEFEVIPSIVYVDDDGPGEPLENGSQAYPYDSIQEAVDIVPAGGTVVILDGTYTGSGNNEINFNGKALTLQSENGPQNCIIDCQSGSRAFYLYNNETNDSVIQGFTITRGYAYEGSAIYLFYVSPTIKDCIITNNWAYGSMTGGGGIYCSASSPLIDNCVFTKNSAYFGGAIQIIMNSSPMITNSVFVENEADNAGGAIYLKQSSAVIQNCRLTANKTSNVGGAIYSSSYTSYSVVNCTITDNTATNQGGGINCFDSSPVISNCIFTNNNNNAIYESHSSSDPNVVYCSFYNNSDGDYYDNDTSATYTSAANINTNVPQASNNIDGDPLYAANGYWDGESWVDGDCRLKSQTGRWDPNATQWVYDAVTSPCVDAGDPNSDWTKELWPHGKRINIGTYGGTRQASMSASTLGSASDLDNDGVTDTKDLGIFGGSWLDEDAALLPGDLNRDGQMNLLDFADFADGWGRPAD